jgi:hypothetical protein
MITEKLVPNINNKPLKVNKKSVPQSTNRSLPMLFNTSLYIGSKGVGKSYKLVSLLKMYEESPIKDDNGIEYEPRIILIAPTAQSGANQVYQLLKYLDQENDVHTEYSDELMLSILEDIKQKQEEYDEYLLYKQIYKNFMKTKNIDKMDFEELEILEINNFMSPEEIYGIIKPKVNFIIYDDLIGCGCFNKKAKSVITNLCIKHRHLRCNLIFTTQSYKSIPVVIRNNIDIYVIFKSSSYVEIINKIHEEISGYVKLDDFIELYEYSTQERNDALVIINNSMSKSGTRFYKNFGTELLITH